VAKLSHLKILNLCGNHISVMEGLKELKLLTWLSIANNHIKAIEQLNQVSEFICFSAKRSSLIGGLS
jgi:Leucine-rich repeat (LRR) protein